MPLPHVNLRNIFGPLWEFWSGGTLASWTVALKKGGYGYAGLTLGNLNYRRMNPGTPLRNLGPNQLVETLITNRPSRTLRLLNHVSARDAQRLVDEGFEVAEETPIIDAIELSMTAAVGGRTIYNLPRWYRAARAFADNPIAFPHPRAPQLPHSSARRSSNYFAACRLTQSPTRSPWAWPRRVALTCANSRRGGSPRAGYGGEWGPRFSSGERTTLAARSRIRARHFQVTARTVQPRGRGKSRPCRY